MKKILMLCFICLGFMSCVDKDDVLSDANKINLNNAITTTDYTIPTEKGKITIVVARSEASNTLIAIDTVSSTILVPKGVQIKSYIVQPSSMDSIFNVLNINQSNGNENNSFKNPGNYQLWQTIAFEDLKEGDNDYNDLVFHCLYRLKNKELRIGIQPIALGGVLKITLGCDIYKGTTLIKSVTVADNCRQQLFKNCSGFLNTTKNINTNQPIINFTNDSMMTTVVKYTFTQNDMSNNGAISVNWFIEVYDKNGNTIEHRFNALSTHYIDNHMLDVNNNPYGIVMTWTGKSMVNYITPYINAGHDWFNYPYEKTNINIPYQYWYVWLRESTKVFSEVYADGYQSVNVFPAAQNGLYLIKSGHNDLWSSWINDTGVRYIDAN